MARMQSIQCKKTAITLVGLLALSLGACGTEETDVSDPSAYLRMSNRWPSPEIGVCWESSTDAYPTEKEWVRSKVQSQYETKTRLRFKGWNRCSANSRGIRIAVHDKPGSNPHTKGLGRTLDGVKNGMELNFTFNNWSRSCKRDRKKCIESIGVHEFGHAIGLAHEHNRPDTPSTCHQSRQGTNGDRTVGNWDVNSVMNYCNPVYNNGGNLSAGDVAGINLMY